MAGEGKRNSIQIDNRSTKEEVVVEIGAPRFWTTIFAFTLYYLDKALAGSNMSVEPRLILLN